MGDKNRIVARKRKEYNFLKVQTVLSRNNASMKIQMCQFIRIGSGVPVNRPRFVQN